MIKMLLTGKAKIAALLLGGIALMLAGRANPITFHNFTGLYDGCVTLTVSPTGAIVCNKSGSNNKPFNFINNLCPEGISIDTSNGQLDCATTTPSCTLSAKATNPVVAGSAWVEPRNDRNEVTLTANCSNGPETFYWTPADGLVVPSSGNTATVRVPPNAVPGVYAYSVSASNADGVGNVASALVKVGSDKQKGPHAYLAHSGDISVIDTATGIATTPPINVGVDSQGVAVNAAGTRVYTSNVDSSVSVVDADTNKVIKKIITSQVGPINNPVGVAVNPRGTRVYVANSGEKTVAVIDTAANEMIGTVAVDYKPYGVAVNQAGNQIYVTHPGDGKVSVVDVTAVPSTTLPVTVNVGLTPYGIAVSGSRVFVTNSGTNTISVFDIASTGNPGIPKPPVTVGNNPKGIDVSPDGTKVYVVNSGGRTISVIDAQTLEVTNTVPVGALPESVSFNPTGTLAYVTNQGNNTVSVIDVAAGSANLPVVGVPGGNLWAFGKFIGGNAINQGMWYDPNEDGWGLTVTRHGNMIFSAIYTFDNNKKPTWYVISKCPVINNSCTGEIFRVTGGAPPDRNWNAVNPPASVGTGTLTFADADHGKFEFKINDQAVQMTESKTKQIEKFVFATDTTPPPVDYTDMWYNPSESGWGVALTQQYGMIFAAWYSYDAAGQPIWFVASSCPVLGMGCTGDVYQVTGGTFLDSTWSSIDKETKIVGNITLSFENDANNGKMIYTPKDSVPIIKDITRQNF